MFLRRSGTTRFTKNVSQKLLFSQQKASSTLKVQNPYTQDTYCEVPIHDYNEAIKVKHKKQKQTHFAKQHTHTQNITQIRNNTNAKTRERKTQTKHNKQ